MRRIAVVGLAAGALLVAGCGTSKEDKAKSQVCDARADIKKQVDGLKGQTASTVTVDSVKKSLQAIGDDLNKMADAQGDLSDDRRSEVQQANQAFKAQIKEIGATVLRSTSLQEAQTQLKSAVTDLADTYGSTLAKVDCS
jgi:hypothetical protein